MAGRASASAVWQCGRFRLALDRPLLMGILNLTPDSFSDGGAHADASRGLAHARRMLAAGADMIDVGGESTRPGSEEVPPAEELRRVERVVQALARTGDVPVSIDTRHASVARACVELGARAINDVAGFRDPAMVEVAASSDAGCVVMHMQGEPGTMQERPRYDDVVAEVRDYLLAQARVLKDAGVARERIALDPGIGFGKTREHNLEILRRLDAFAALGYPLLLGVSRKRFIGEITGVGEPAQRVAGSVAAAVWCATHGADVVRVHDVVAHVRAMRVADALGE
jgi:dihydropteroate synthase